MENTNRLIDFITRQEITEEPLFKCISVNIPCDKYDEKMVANIADGIHQFLGANKIYHMEPEITNIYTYPEENNYNGNA